MSNRGTRQRWRWVTYDDSPWDYLLAVIVGIVLYVVDSQGLDEY